MVYPLHTRIQLEGHLSGLAAFDEIWSNTIAVTIGSAGGSYVSDPQAYADALAAPISAWYSNPASGMVSTSRLNVIKVNNILPDGHYADSTTHQHVFATPVAGGAGNGQAPAFCSVAYTWETGITRALAHRGRIYPPNYDYIPTGSTISASDVLAAANAGKALLNAILTTADSASHLVSPAVVSRVRGGAIREITAVSVDDIYDVQRRRKNALPSVRQQVAFP